MALIICHSRRFVYFHLHKCGGTSVEMALEPFLSWQDLLLGSTEYGEVASEYYIKRHGLYKHSSVADVERVCGGTLLQDYYQFANVRDPVSRVCSLYNYVAGFVDALEQEVGIDRAALRQHYGEFPTWQWLLEWAATRALVFASDFSEFLRDPQLEEDPAFRTQVSQLTARDGSLEVECFRLEDQLDAMRATLSERFGLMPDIPHENKSGASAVRRQDISAADVEFIRRRFEGDCRRFGY